MRIAIVESTHWHMPLYLDALEAPGLRVVGITDSAGKTGEALAKRFGCDVLVSGAGANITVDGPGIVAIANSNNYAGNWKVAGGTLRLSTAGGAGSGSITVGTNGVLEEVTLASPDKREWRHACDTFMPFFGLTIKLGPIAEFGLNLHEDRIPVDTEKFESSTPGIFAIGDINAYPGKLKLILCGFHEAALMAQAAFHICRPNEKLRFQYTTSSSSLQKKLGVA